MPRRLNNTTLERMKHRRWSPEVDSEHQRMLRLLSVRGLVGLCGQAANEDTCAEIAGFINGNKSEVAKRMQNSIRSDNHRWWSVYYPAVLRGECPESPLLGGLPAPSLSFRRHNEHLQQAFLKNQSVRLLHVKCLAVASPEWDVVVRLCQNEILQCYRECVADGLEPIDREVRLLMEVLSETACPGIAARIVCVFYYLSTKEGFRFLKRCIAEYGARQAKRWASYDRAEFPNLNVPPDAALVLPCEDDVPVSNSLMDNLVGQMKKTQSCHVFGNGGYPVAANAMRRGIATAMQEQIMAMQEKLPLVTTDLKWRRAGLYVYVPVHQIIQQASQVERRLAVEALRNDSAFVDVLREYDRVYAQYPLLKREVVDWALGLRRLHGVA